MEEMLIGDRCDQNSIAIPGQEALFKAPPPAVGTTRDRSK
jgi:hypothetical protein